MTVPAPTIVRRNPEFMRAVDEAAVRLCIAHSEDGTFHTDCPALAQHWQQAHRALFDEWQAQGEA